MRVVISLFVFFMTSKVLAQELIYPVPIVPTNFEGIDPNNTAEVRERIKLTAAIYIDTFISDFLRINSLNEDLFDRISIHNDVDQRVIKMPAKDLMDPKALIREVITMRNSMIEYTRRVYTPDKVAAMRASGRGVKFDRAFVDRVQRLETQVQEIAQNRLNVPSPELQGIQQRLGVLEDALGKIDPPASAPLAQTKAPSNGMAAAALVLAAGSFLFQLMSRKK